MTAYRRAFIACYTILTYVLPLQADEISIASFNIRIFSHRSRDDSELSRIVDELKDYDLIAIQELRDTRVMDRTIALLQDRGLSYRAEVSPPVGRKVKELYAFLYRSDRVTLLTPGQVWSDPEDKFIREPFFATFRAGAFDFTLVTIHLIFGDSISDRRREARLLEGVYTQIQDSDLMEDDVILLGDFNLPADDQGFELLRRMLFFLIPPTQKTTISDASSYDNFWFDRSFVKEYMGKFGIDRFDETAFGNDDKAASLAVSDHRPIWALFSIDGPDDDGDSEGEE